ncbi:MAG: CAP domain-containing protein [Oscillospiraceae bacterium]|jgi:hypothetical protein|nr:CAP domain-containing protein [Oscillospiraceae bacterium]
MKHIKKLFCLAVVLFTITAIVTVSVRASDSGSVPSDEELRVLEVVNAERAQYGLTPLEWHDDAYSAAKVRAEESVVSFSHTRPDGSYFSSIWSELGLSYAYAAENIAYGYRSAESVVAAWMRSDGHRANILSSDVTYMAAALYGGDTWAQEFFSPYGAYAPENTYIGIVVDKTASNADIYTGIYTETQRGKPNDCANGVLYGGYDCDYYVCAVPKYNRCDYCQWYIRQPAEWSGGGLQGFVPEENLIVRFGASCP